MKHHVRHVFHVLVDTLKPSGAVVTSNSTTLCCALCFVCISRCSLLQPRMADAESVHLRLSQLSTKMAVLMLILR
jgi:hypothetical protein